MAGGGGGGANDGALSEGAGGTFGRLALSHTAYLGYVWTRATGCRRDFSTIFVAQSADPQGVGEGAAGRGGGRAGEAGRRRDVLTRGGGVAIWRTRPLRPNYPPKTKNVFLSGTMQL